MYLKKLILHGFKSFANRTEIDFRPGITAIVGPNGSGKSNISDAIRWVLGEQSPRSLRSQRMEDVIFAGGDGRRPAGFAEVGLIFSNEDGALPLDFDEVFVARRVFRSGESEYIMNKARCRLKDIERLFGASGIGRNGYSIIEQGRIDAILGDRGESRRAFFEEVSGISGYKAQALQTAYELEQLRLTFSRIQDILSEIEGFLLPLEEKATRATHYLEYKKRLRDAELAYLLDERESILGRKARAAARKADLVREREAIEVQRERLSSELESARRKLASLEEEQDAIRDEEGRLAAALEREKAELSAVQERARRTQEDLERLKTERTRKRERFDAINARIGEVKKSLGDLAVEIGALEEKEKGLEDREKEFKSAIEDVRRKGESLRADLIEILNRIASLKNEIASLEREMERKRRFCAGISEKARGGARPYSPGVQAILAKRREGRFPGILGVVGELITVPPDYQEAIDVALGRSFEDIITRSEKDARDAIGFLKAGNLGRATFLPLDTLVPATFPANLMRTLTARWQVRLASDLVSYPAEILPAVLYLLGRILVVRDLNAATAVSRACEARFRVVTLEGDVVSVGGAITGGSSPAKARGTGLELEARMAEKELRELEEAKLRHERELSRFFQERDAANLKAERIRAEEKELEQKWEACLGEITAVKVRLGQARQEEAAARRLLRELEDESESLAELLADYDSALAAQASGFDRNEDAIARKEEEIRSLASSLSSVRERIAAQRGERTEVAGMIRRYEAQLRKLDEEASALVPRISACEVELADCAARLEDVERRLREEIGVDPDALEVSYRNTREHTTREEREREIAGLRAAIEALGPVDTGAISDCERMKGRRDRVARVLSDLVSASRTLEELLALGNSLAEKRFLSVFREVGQQFGNMFRRLFGGGEAELALRDPSRPLESPIEILPKPPGKRLGSLSLLSAGEKALCAISLMFAVLATNPCPFVVLDEADASLDEANLLRFTSLLGELAMTRQIIVITHRKLTMEACDALYGVTMEEPGVSRVISINLEDKVS